MIVPAKMDVATVINTDGATSFASACTAKSEENIGDPKNNVRPASDPIDNAANVPNKSTDLKLALTAGPSSASINDGNNV